MLAEKLRLMLEEAGVSFKTNTKSFVMGCPRCRKREKLYIRKTDGRFVCWVCNETEGYHGAAEWCLTDLTGKPVDQIRRYLYGETAPVSQFIDIRFDEFFGVDDEIPVFVEVGLKPLDDDPGFRALDTPAGAAGAAYLAKRKVPTDIALQYGIKAWPAKKSVVFPVVYRGVQVGWQTRYIEDTATPFSQWFGGMLESRIGGAMLRASGTGELLLARRLAEQAPLQFIENALKRSSNVRVQPMAHCFCTPL